MYMLLSSEETLYQVSTHAFSAKGRAEQISAELFYPTKKTLLKKQAQEQTGYITTAAQAAYASLNKLDWTKTFYGYVELTPNTQDSINFDGNSSGLGYALALALEWRKQLNKPTDYEAEAFATGEIHSSGAVTEIGHLETKITAACNFMEKKNAVTQTQQPFVIFYPNANQDDVTPELQTRVAAIGGKLCPVERLQSALTILLGDAYDGDSEGRWEPFKGLLSFNYEDSLRFFGRERALTKLNKEFNEAEGLLVVTGVSGSGKSSLIKAGLIPQINKELPEGNTLDWLISTPKAHNSVESLLLELLNTLHKHWSIGTNSKGNSDKGESDADNDSGLDALSKEAIPSPDTFIAAIQQAQLLQPNKRIFYYIDQYEDIFNHQDISREQAQQLAPLLAKLAKQIPNLDIVISIRSEYEDILGKYGSVSHVNPELNASEWRDIVYKQATSFGLRYEPELEKRISNEAANIEHALPALEYLLEQLYSKAKKADKNARLLTHEHYDQLNGIRGVIAARAEEAIALHLDQANAFFEYFVGLNDEGMPCTKSVSLTLIEKENHSLYQLVQTFIAERLVVDCSTKQNNTQQEKCVKLAHDTLLNFEEEESSWQRLKIWFEKNHDYLRWYKQIAANFKRWNSIQITNLSEPKLKTRSENNKEESNDSSQELLLSKFDLTQIQSIQQYCLINNQAVVSYIGQSQQYYQFKIAKELKKEKEYAASILALNAEIKIRENKIKAALVEANHNYALGLNEKAEDLLKNGRMTAAKILNAYKHKYEKDSSYTLNQVDLLGAYSDKDVTTYSIKNCSLPISFSHCRNYVIYVDGNDITLLNILTGTYQCIGNRKIDIHFIEFAFDKNTIIYGSDRSLFLGNVYVDEIQTVREFEGIFQCIAFSPKKGILATSPGDNTILLWDVRSGKNFKLTYDKYTCFTSLQFSNDGEKLVSGSESGEILLWNIKVRSFILLGVHDDGVVLTLSFSHNNRHVASGSKGNSIRIWDVINGNYTELIGHKNFVWDVDFSPNGLQVVSASLDKKIRVWDLSTKQFEEYEGHSEGVYKVVFSLDGLRAISSSSDDQTIKIWELNKEYFQDISFDKEFSYSNSGQYIAFSGNNIKLINIVTGKSQTFSMKAENIIISPKGRYLIIDSLSGFIIFNVENGHCYEVITPENIEYSLMKFSADELLIIFPSSDHVLRSFNVTENCLQDLCSYRGEVYEIDISRDGGSIVLALDSGVQIYDTYTGNNRVVMSECSEVYNAKFSPDGQTLLTGHDSGEIKLWNLPYNNSTSLHPHEDSVQCVNFSPCGKFFLTLSDDKTVRLWSTVSNQYIKLFESELCNLLYVAFLEEGNKIILIADIIRIYNVPNLFYPKDKWVETVTKIEQNSNIKLEGYRLLY
jgi:WD40 repeat protein/energy-coupling factor transporter ATP-binding protein EcfA2